MSGGLMDTGRVLILFGPPGSGKGTQAARLASALKIPAISTGEILRGECQSGSELGQELSALLSSGQLVNDRLVDEVIARRLRNPDCAAGCILDGYPRTVSQARFLDELLGELGLGYPTALDFSVSPRQVITRLERRRQCPRCGRIFSVDDGGDSLGCELDGATLVRRADDHPDAIRQRLRLYKQNAGELVRYYRNKGSYHRIRADRALDDVTNQMFSALELNRRTDRARPGRTLAPRGAY